MARTPKTPSEPVPVAKGPRKAGRPTSAKPRAAKPKPVMAEMAPEPAPLPSPAPEPAADNPFALPGEDQRQMLETLSLNLARAAMTAQSAIAEAALSQADRPAALSPDPFNVGPAMNSVMNSLASRPDKLFAAQADLFNRYMDLWASSTRRAAGEEPPAPSKDKRFKDPAWSENPMFDMMRQSYLVTSDWMNGLVSSVEDVDPRTKRRAEFFTKLLTDAFSPSNFLASNPAALKAMQETNGESLVKGM
ncbi:MAG: class I poly(R)-hydroxyalkanoic acid synthase, partial [Pseudomonadota bacterium]